MQPSLTAPSARRDTEAKHSAGTPPALGTPGAGPRSQCQALIQTWESPPLIQSGNPGFPVAPGRKLAGYCIWKHNSANSQSRWPRARRRCHRCRGYSPMEQEASGTLPVQGHNRVPHALRASLLPCPAAMETTQTHEDTNFPPSVTSTSHPRSWNAGCCPEREHWTPSPHGWRSGKGGRVIPRQERDEGESSGAPCSASQSPQVGALSKARGKGVFLKGN